MAQTLILLDRIFWTKSDPLAYITNELAFYNKSDELYCTLLWEPYALPYVEDAIRALEQALAERNIENYTVVLNEVLEPLNVKIKNVQYTDPLLYWAYLGYKPTAVNTKWNPDGETTLFMVGKPDRTNRIFLLYKLYEANMLGDVSWSLFIDPNTLVIDRSREVLSFLSDDEYKQFITLCTRNLDRIALDPKFKIFHHNGSRYDESLYSNTHLSIITETLYENSIGRGFDKRCGPFITEKTWRVILNRHPFVMANVAGSLRKIAKMGFKTFTEYMVIPDYDDIEDPYKRIDAIVSNVKHFKRRYLKDDALREQINQDIEHNFNYFIEYAKQVGIDCPVLNHELALNYNVYHAR